MATAAVAVTVTKTRLAIVDDHPVFRCGLAAILARVDDFEIVGEAGSVEEAIRLVRMPLDVVILDVNLSDGGTGVTVAARIKEAQPRCRILALSASNDPHIVAAMFRAGATGFALKSSDVDDIVQAIYTVRSGTVYLPPAGDGAIAPELAPQGDRPLQTLTRREREIFDLMIGGQSNKEIGARLFISVRTVETHRFRLMNKLAARTMAELVRLSVRDEEHQRQELADCGDSAQRGKGAR